MTARARGAHVAGSDAFLLATFLRRADVNAFLRRLAGTSIDPRRVASLRDAVDTIAAAAADYEAAPTSANGSTEGLSAEVPAGSEHETDEWISVERAAGLLGVGSRRVRQLLADERLEWRRPGREYLVSRESVLIYRDHRRTA